MSARNTPRLKSVQTTGSSEAPVVEPKVGGTDGGGGGMDDVLKRLGSVESNVSDIRAKVSGIEATLPHLATKADLASLETSLIKWFVVTAISLTVLAFTIARYVAPA